MKCLIQLSNRRKCGSIEYVYITAVSRADTHIECFTIGPREQAIAFEIGSQDIQTIASIALAFPLEAEGDTFVGVRLIEL